LPVVKRKGGEEKKKQKKKRHPYQPFAVRQKRRRGGKREERGKKKTSHLTLLTRTAPPRHPQSGTEGKREKRGNAAFLSWLMRRDAGGRRRGRGKRKGPLIPMKRGEGKGMCFFRCLRSKKKKKGKRRKERSSLALLHLTLAPPNRRGGKKKEKRVLLVPKRRKKKGKKKGKGSPGAMSQCGSRVNAIE